MIFHFTVKQLLIAGSMLIALQAALAAPMPSSHGHGLVKRDGKCHSSNHDSDGHGSDGHDSHGDGVDKGNDIGNSHTNDSPAGNSPADDAPSGTPYNYNFVSWGAPFKDNIMKLHGELRASKGAQELTWCDGTAAKAQTAAQKLAANNGQGEVEALFFQKSNKYVSSSSGKEDIPLATEAIDSWKGQKQGEYKLMVQADAKQIGCGTANSGSKSYFVCIYTIISN